MISNNGYSRPHTDRKHIEWLVTRLLELQTKTDPAQCVDASSRKDLDAVWAIKLVGQLTEHLAGWAFDHLAGLAVAGMAPIPLPPRFLDEDEEYSAARTAASDHKHEAVGSRARVDADGATQEAMSPDAMRLFLIHVMRSKPFGQDWGCSTTALANALESLTYGDVSPLVHPSADWRKVSREEIECRLTAIRHVLFRRECGTLKYVAEQEVADAFGQDRETIRGWGKELRKDPVRWKIVQARAEASARFDRKPASEDVEDRMRAKMCNDLYGNDALRLDGLEFKRVLQAKADRRQKVVRKIRSANQNSGK